MARKVTFHKLHTLLRVIDMQDARLERLEHDFPGIWSSRPVFRRIDHAPGWDPLLWETLRAARRLDPDLKVAQIKQKMGVLVIYFEQGSIEQKLADRLW